MTSYAINLAVKPETVVVVSISLEEVVVVTPAQSDRLLRELKAAEARIAAGEGIVFDRNDQRARFEQIFAKGG